MAPSRNQNQNQQTQQNDGNSTWYDVDASGSGNAFDGFDQVRMKNRQSNIILFKKVVAKNFFLR